MRNQESGFNKGYVFFRSLSLSLIDQSISCLKKAVWISPSNFVCLYNLGLVLLTAQQYASAFHTLAAATSVRPDSAECFMLLGSIYSNSMCESNQVNINKWHNIFLNISNFSVFAKFKRSWKCISCLWEIHHADRGH